jgi:Protein of unknown function (DUF4242)
MSEYLVEVYVPRAEASVVREAADRARSAADAVSGEGTAVRYIRAIFVPEDETCFHVFEAVSREAVRATSERAELPAHRIVRSVAVTLG